MSGVSSTWTLVGYKNMQSFLSDSQTFFDLSSDGSPPAISSVVKQPLKKYGDTLKDKLIMQTYGGESVISGSISGLQRFFVRTTLLLTFSIVLLID